MPHIFLTLDNLFLFMDISSIARLLALTQGQWSSWCHTHPVFMVTLSSVTPVTIHRCSSAPGRELFSNGEDFQAVVPSLTRDSFSQLWKCSLFCFMQTTKFADTLPSGHTHWLPCFLRTLDKDCRYCYHGLAFSPPLTLLLADEKLNSPLLVVSRGGRTCSQANFTP